MAAIPGTVVSIQSVAQLNEATARDATLSIVYFWADFHDACRPNGQLDVVVRQLATLHPRLRFFKVAAEELPELSERFEITVVPTFVILQGPNKLETLEGASVAELAKRVEVWSQSLAKRTATVPSTLEEPSSSAVPDALAYRLEKLITAAPVMLFMKGTPRAPQCGFSRDLVALLNAEHIPFGTFDILQDDDVRQGLKTFSNWPTYPQLYVNGKLIGGLDIVKEMQAEGPLVDQLGVRPSVEAAADALATSLRALVRSAPVLVFMKGTPQAPQCGFSKQLVELLRAHEIAFSAFDILSDDQVRQGLKTFSNWPTYPQLYVNGKLIGGLDIVQELAQEGPLSDQLGVPKKEKQGTETPYDQLVRRARVMIFIKGTPTHPKCGFSRQLVEILDAHGFSYDYFDILTDERVRQGLKAYSNWPTFPQLYVKGELIGGLDIVQQLQEDGELDALKNDEVGVGVACS
ncbi:hypothetical protein PsorP6_014781 [Peronosclerospora sorghi]|uniref:Uncharacterized protein n=1 Tax=Peronosclerospora sorghi TaxID=230839 RepID=A0ACC0VS32_9STRA|nr:hypothetical protein PsorP6_014781 [Peronosclerospora sorghi]